MAENRIMLQQEQSPVLAWLTGLMDHRLNHKLDLEHKMLRMAMDVSQQTAH